MTSSVVAFAPTLLSPSTIQIFSDGVASQIEGYHGSTLGISGLETLQFTTKPCCIIFQNKTTRIWNKINGKSSMLFDGYFNILQEMMPFGECVWKRKREREREGHAYDNRCIFTIYRSLATDTTEWHGGKLSWSSKICRKSLGKKFKLWAPQKFWDICLILNWIQHCGIAKSWRICHSVGKK